MIQEAGSHLVVMLNKTAEITLRLKVKISASAQCKLLKHTGLKLGSPWGSRLMYVFILFCKINFQL